MARKRTVSPSIIAELSRMKRSNSVGSHTSFVEAFQAFLDVSIAKGLSPDTTQSYRKEITQLQRHLVDIGADLSDIRNLTAEDVESFKTAMIERGFARSTINTRIRTAKIFGNFCVGKKLIPSNPASGVEVLKERHEVGPTFSKAQLRRILDAPNLTTFEGLRDLAVMRTLADTGIRVSELHALDVGDVLFADKSINVQRAKNRYGRRIPLTARLQAILTAYLRVRGVSDSTDALFITATDDRLAVGSIQYQIRRHGRASGVIDAVQCSPHVFRRTFAKFKIQAGVDVFTLQRLMGHSDINELRKYVAIYSTDLDAAIEDGVEY